MNVYPAGTGGEAVGQGDPQSVLDDADIDRICADLADSWDVDGKRVLVLVPDRTRTCPLAQVFAALHRHLAPRVAKLEVMIALGTHQPMAEDDIRAHLGLGDAARHAREFPKVAIHNHAWQEPGVLTDIGRLGVEEVERLSEGRMAVEVPVVINRLATEVDRILVVGPVFPHEVAGYSGGNKYLFPGISGQGIIDFFHWLGALITNRGIIGVKHTPVRAVLDRCAALLPADKRALCMVVRPKDESLAGLFHGSCEAAWSRAADVSSALHVRWFDRPFRRILSCCPPMYADLWTAGKGVYKLEPVVADGGEIVVYAPHVQQVSAVHGHVLERIGYHVRDYFVAQWDRFRDEPWGVLAHSTHVRGDGRFEEGVEKPRIQVTLATGIPAAMCRQIGLGYMDPTSVRIEDWQGREADGVLCVPRAGEVLHRLA